MSEFSLFARNFINSLNISSKVQLNTEISCIHHHSLTTWCTTWSSNEDGASNIVSCDNLSISSSVLNCTPRVQLQEHQYFIFDLFCLQSPSKANWTYKSIVLFLQSTCHSYWPQVESLKEIVKLTVSCCETRTRFPSVITYKNCWREDTKSSAKLESIFW